MAHTVKKVSGIAAAWIHDRSPGIGKVCPAGTAQYWA